LHPDLDAILTLRGGPNRVSPLDIYLIAIGGTGMAPLACLLKASGHRVRGSDGPLYPPMSTLLEEAAIDPIEGFSAENLMPAPDLVIVGNAVPRTHPEAEAVEALGLPRISMPEALYRFFLKDRHPLVVAGTHGKTTTTSIAAWVYEDCGLSPSYLIGGVPVNFDKSFHLGAGDRFVIEGDEYNAAYFDRGPKFLHYAPETLILTSVEYDHADLYPNHESLLARYTELVEGIPETGHLAACGDSEDVRAVAARARCAVTLYGIGKHNDVHPVGAIDSGPGGSRLTVAIPNGASLDLDIPLFGEHNVANSLGRQLPGRLGSGSPGRSRTDPRGQGALSVRWCQTPHGSRRPDRSPPTRRRRRGRPRHGGQHSDLRR